MERDTSTRLMRYAETVSKLSSDPSTQVGCILLDKNKKVISEGFNDKPFNWYDTYPWDIKEEKYKYVIHAEINAVATCTKKPYYAVVTLFPCSNCAKALIASGVKEIYYKDIRMNDDASIVFTLCHMTGVKLIQIQK